MQPLDQGPVRVWEVDSGAQVAALESKEDTETFPQVSWRADGTLLSAISFSGLFSVWRLDTALPSALGSVFLRPGLLRRFRRPGN
jgi:hypothetical protein